MSSYISDSHQEPSKLRLFPIGEIIDKVEERLRVKVTSRGKLEQVMRVGKRLDGLSTKENKQRHRGIERG